MTKWAVVKPGKTAKVSKLVSIHDTREQADAALKLVGSPEGWRVAEVEWSTLTRPAGKVD